MAEFVGELLDFATLNLQKLLMRVPSCLEPCELKLVGTRVRQTGRSPPIPLRVSQRFEFGIEDGFR
jgi:hypothetical protein